MKEDVKIVIAAGAGLAAVLFTFLWKKSPVSRTYIERIIVKEAENQGLDPKIALLFADLESGIKNITGDEDWIGNPVNYKKVFELYSKNPYVDNKKLWKAYGPFQLLAVWHLKKVDSMGSPELLSNVKTNVRIGVDVIKKLYKKYNGDLLKTRMAFVCGYPGACSEKKAEIIAKRLIEKLEKYDLPAYSVTIVRARKLAAQRYV